MGRTVRDANLETRTARLRLSIRTEPYWRGLERGLRSATGGGPREAPGSRVGGKPMADMPSIGSAPRMICRMLTELPCSITRKRKRPRGSGGERKRGERKGMIRGRVRSQSLTPWLNTSTLTSGAAGRPL